MVFGAGAGHPLFRCAGADYFRDVEDIREGDGKQVDRIALWCVNTSLLVNEKTFLPNMEVLQKISLNFERSCIS